MTETLLPSMTDPDKQSILHAFIGNDARDPINSTVKVSNFQKKFMVPFCFLMASIGVGVPWIACSTAVAYFADKFGPDIYKDFLLFYNLPGIPIYFLQAKFDTTYDKRFGKNISYNFRVVFCSILFAATLIYIPYANDKWVVNMLVLGMGIWDPIGFGTISRASSIFTEQASACVLIGVSGGSIITLILSLAIGFGVKPEPHKVQFFFFFAVGVVALGLLLFFYVMLSSVGEYYINAEKRNESSQDENDTLVGDRELTFKEFMSKLLELLIAQTILFTSYLMIISNTTEIPSVTGLKADNEALAQKLVYANLFGLFLGRQFNVFSKPTAKRFLCITGLRSLLFWCYLLCFTLVPFVLYMGGFWGHRHDIGFVGVMSIYFIATGYLNSVIYTYTARAVSPKNRETATSYINIALMLGVMLGIGFSYILNYFLGRGGDKPHGG